MVNISRQFRDSINRKWTVRQVVDTFITTNYDETQSGGFTRLNPCPLTDSDQNAFSIKIGLDGYEHFTCFSNSWNSDIWNDLPEVNGYVSGTAGDLLACLSNDQTDLLSKMNGQNRVTIQKKVPTKVVKMVQDPEIIQEDFELYISNMGVKLINWIPAMDYYCNERFFDPKTVRHFNIGYQGAVKDDDEWFHRFVFPFYVGKQIVHMKYKIIEKSYLGDYKTNQVKNNSGGDYLFNENDLQKEVVFICEGEHDAMRIWERYCSKHQHIGVVALSGNANTLKWNKVKEAGKVGKYIIAFDNDDAGMKYTLHAKLLLGLFIKSEIVYMGEDKDPDDAMRCGRYEIITI